MEIMKLFVVHHPNDTVKILNEIKPIGLFATSDRITAITAVSAAPLVVPVTIVPTVGSTQRLWLHCVNGSCESFFHFYYPFLLVDEVELTNNFQHSLI